MNYDKTMSFEEIEKYFLDFFKSDTVLKRDIIEECPCIYNLIDVIFQSIKGNKDGNSQDIYLNETEQNQLMYFHYLLPIYYFSDKYENFKEFIETYLLLINNYVINYTEFISSKLMNSVNSLNNLVKTESHFERLIEISGFLIARYEKEKHTREEPFTISKTYLKELLNIEAKD